MRLILAVDSVLLGFFTKTARAFARLTGRSNFFLAKTMVCVMTACFMIATANYWLPLLDFRPPLSLTILMALNAFLCIYDLHRCDKAEDMMLGEKRTAMFFPLYYSPSFRVLTAVVAFSWIFIELPSFVSPKGFLFAKIVFLFFLPSYTAFIYFAVIDPPSVGKSKIQEWAEGFANLFRKPVPIPVKSK